MAKGKRWPKPMSPKVGIKRTRMASSYGITSSNTN